MLAVRHSQKAFGRGAQRFITPANRKILCFLRVFEGATILCVSNLSRTSQAVQLDLSEFAGFTPVDLLGGSPFPTIGQLPYMLTFPPYAFYWFLLEAESDLPGGHLPLTEPLPEYTTLVLRGGLTEILAPAARTRLETDILPQYLRLRRWFASKDQRITAVHLQRSVAISDGTVILAEIDVQLGDRSDTYLLPLAVAWDDQPMSPVQQQLALARVRRGRRTGFLTDAFTVDSLTNAVMTSLRAEAKLPFEGGEIRFVPTAKLAEIDIPADAPIRRLSAEQSNSSLIVGTSVMLKVLRRVTAGIHPEVEMSEHLTAAGYANAPPLLGAVWRMTEDTAAALIVVQGFVPNQGDGWGWTQSLLARAGDALAVTDSSSAEEAEEFSNYVAFAAAIGTRLAELHAVLARPSDNADFAPEIATDKDAKAWAKDVTGELTAALAAIKTVSEWPDEAAAADAAFLLENARALGTAITQLTQTVPGALKTRIHGDFHLGQVLVAKGDAYLIDFEGEPARPLSERREKSSPMRDVAGMVRSFDYARAMASIDGTPLTGQATERRIQLLERANADATAGFLAAYRAVHDATETRWASPEAEPVLLDLFLVQKAAYEIRYEAANRVAWLAVPMRGLAALARRFLKEQAGSAS
jgi:maltose alpha-D-glucosyltransferase/alpha-amylase